MDQDQDQDQIPLPRFNEDGSISHFSFSTADEEQTDENA